jgi:DNA-binding NtrC family response regulator
MKRPPDVIALFRPTGLQYPRAGERHERVVAIEDREHHLACLPRDPSPQKRTHQAITWLQPDTIDELSKDYIQQALLATGGNLRKAAPLLAVSYRTLRYLIEKYELKAVRREERRGEPGEREELKAPAR